MSKGATTRSGRAQKEKHRDLDLTTVRNKLDLYEDLEDFFEDLHHVLHHGNQVYEVSFFENFTLNTLKRPNQFDVELLQPQFVAQITQAGCG